MRNSLKIYDRCDRKKKKQPFPTGNRWKPLTNMREYDRKNTYEPKGKELLWIGELSIEYENEKNPYERNNRINE